MDMKTMEKLEEGFCEVLHKYAERGMNSSSDVETAKAALSGMVKTRMLKEMENYEAERSGRYYDDGMSSRSYRRDSMGRYADNGGMSYRRYHDDGSYEGGFSGHDMRQQLERMMQETDSERERQALRAAMQKL